MISLSRRSLAKSCTFAAAALTLSLPHAFAQSTATADGTSSAAVAPLTPAQFDALLDPDMATVIHTFESIMGTPITKLSVQDARQQFSAQDAAKIVARTSGKAEQAMFVPKIEDTVIDGSDGNQIPIRIYTPGGAGPFPVVLYFHGGGFVIATIDTYDASARALAVYSKAIVISVEYRKAPEHFYPAALHDAIASYKWTINNIGSYNGIATKVAVAGESAGGNLATEVALAARDQDLQRPTHQLLIYPVTSSNLNQPSDILYENAVPLNTPLLSYFFQQYLSNPSEANDPGVAPINADLHNLPPATVIAAQLDPLESDGMAYAKKLNASGDLVGYRLYTGVTHEFFGMGAVVEKAYQAERYGADRLAASFK